MNIFLIGFMGSGKSTVGKKIAGRIGFAFLDMDAAIEKEQGKSVADIFNELGESGFRAIETAWLRKFSGKNTVIATGGGAPCFENNLAVMKAKGLTVYLESSPENLARRLLNATSSRPLIDGLKHDLPALNHYVKNKLAERLPYYTQCDLTINALSLDAAKLDDFIHQVKKKL